MSLKDTLLKDIQLATLAKNVARRNTLRLMRAAISNAEIEIGQPLSDKDEIEILTREAKRRREAIEEYAPLGRQDKVEEAKIELAIIDEYLPRQMERSEIEALARQAVIESGVSDISGIGDVMRRLMPKVKDRADGRVVSEIVKKLLAEGR